MLACTPALAQDSERTRAIMGRLLESLQVLLAFEGSAAPEVRETTLEAARALAAYDLLLPTLSWGPPIPDLGPRPAERGPRSGVGGPGSAFDKPY